MATLLSCYYVDHPLGEDELPFVQQTLLGPWATFKTGASGVVQKRVPFVVPAPDAHGRYATSREQRAAQLRANLRHAGIRSDQGRQVLWLAPHNAEWDAIFRYAIHEETGCAPYVAQRWTTENGVPTRMTIRIIDTALLLQGL